MQKQQQYLKSPFRQKIFDLMKFQETSKMLKLSTRLFQNNSINKNHSTLRDFSIDTQPIDESKIVKLNTSDSALHFKSLQQKLGIGSFSNQKPNNKKSNSFFQQKSHQQESQIKKVSFIQNRGKKHYSSSKSLRKKQTVNNTLRDNPLKKNKFVQNQKKLFENINKKLSSQGKLKEKTYQFPNSQTNSKNVKHLSNKNELSLSKNNFQSCDKQTEKKKYLLRTLKKMQSVRKNLTQTFQQFDKFNKDTSRSRNQQKRQKKSKEKSKSNLTVLTDYFSEQDHSNLNYGFKRQSNNKSKRKNQNQFKSKSAKKKNQKLTPQKKSVYFNNSILSNERKLKFQDSFQKDYLKKLRQACKNPQKWQIIQKNKWLSLFFRVVKRKLIEIQIHAQSQIQQMKIQLEKGYLICQSLREDYKNVKKKQIITLLCSVRGIDFKQGNIDFQEIPRLKINVQSNNQQRTQQFNKAVDLPYSWIMLAQKYNKDKQNQSSSKKSVKQNFNSQIKTISRMEGIKLKKNLKLPYIVDVFSFCQVQIQSVKKQGVKNPKMKSYLSQKLKLKDIYCFYFVLEDNQFRLNVKLNYEKSINKSTFLPVFYSLEIQGKGQALMGKLLKFLEIIG